MSAAATALKAEGLIRDAIVATNKWKQFETAASLKLEADRTAITADGADISRIIVTAIDTNGTPVDTAKNSISFSIEGLGQLIGENPVQLRAGKMIILAQSGYVPGELTITASSKGLGEAKAIVKMTPPPANWDMPKTLPAKQPTKRMLAQPAVIR